MNGIAYGRDLEVVQQLRPEPMTPEEESAQAKIDPVDFDIFVHKMNMIAQEGKETTMKLGASTGMRWGDVAFGIYTAQGDLAVVATGIWFHAVLGQIPVKYIIKHWLNESSVGIRDGDSFFWNDPFYGGVHGADMGLAAPVFHDGKLVCFVGAIVHTGENGATDPGGMSTRAKSKYDEGLLSPPIKIGEDYSLKEDILTLFAAMNRDPRTMILDIKARLAASRVAQRRITELIDRKGREFFVGSLRRILAVTATAAKKKVSLLNDGVFRQPRFMDSLGDEPGLTKINITMTKKGDTIKLDLHDSTPMFQDKPCNTFFQGIIGLAMVYFCGWFLHDLPSEQRLTGNLGMGISRKLIRQRPGRCPNLAGTYASSLLCSRGVSRRRTHDVSPGPTEGSGSLVSGLRSSGLRRYEPMGRTCCRHNARTQRDRRGRPA